MNLIDPAICNWSPAYLFIFSENIAATFLYYAHFFPSIAALLISAFVLRANPRNKAAQALFFTTTMFIIWCFMSLTTWASEKPEIIMFVWQAMIYFELLIYVGALYFIVAFFKGRFLTPMAELGVFAIFTPLFLLGHTTLNLVGFNFTNCDRNAVEGPLWQYYVYGFEFVFLLMILAVAVKEIKQRRQLGTDVREAVLVTVGVFALLFSFSIGSVIGSFLDNWYLGNAGLAGMPIFVAFLGYILVRYKTFQVKLLATEALMAGQLILLTSLLFVQTIENAQIIAVITIIFFSTLGTLLIKSVRNEVRQRLHIQELAHNLEQTNARLKIVDQQKSEFVSIASHQLRSPLTAIRGYASMLVEGNFGPLTPPQVEPLARIQDSAKLMADSVEDFLNVSRIESGSMKYDCTRFNLASRAETVVQDLQTEATNQGLTLTYRNTMRGDGQVFGDIGKVQQILHNLINNAIKYTPHGTITVTVSDDIETKKSIVTVADTGIGIEKEALAQLFQKFARAKNANSVNTSGTGLGLFVAREMARAMKGDITVRSEGEGKGTQFTLTLPTV
jgi:signal transduction histidine kinase